MRVLGIELGPSGLFQLNVLFSSLVLKLFFLKKKEYFIFIYVSFVFNAWKGTGPYVTLDGLEIKDLPVSASRVRR